MSTSVRASASLPRVTTAGFLRPVVDLLPDAYRGTPRLLWPALWHRWAVWSFFLVSIGGSFFALSQIVPARAHALSTTDLLLIGIATAAWWVAIVHGLNTRLETPSMQSAVIPAAWWAGWARTGALLVVIASMMLVHLAIGVPRPIVYLWPIVVLWFALPPCSSVLMYGTCALQSRLLSQHVQPVWSVLVRPPHRFADAWRALATQSAYAAAACFEQATEAQRAALSPDDFAPLMQSDSPAVRAAGLEYVGMTASDCSAHASDACG